MRLLVPYANFAGSTDTVLSLYRHFQVSKMLEDLPTDLSTRIINQLNTRDKLKAELVCKSWAAISRSAWVSFTLTRQENESCALSLLRKLAASAETAQRLRDITLSTGRSHPIDLSKLWTAPSSKLIPSFWCIADDQYITKRLLLMSTPTFVFWDVSEEGLWQVSNTPGAAQSELHRIAINGAHHRDQNPEKRWVVDLHDMSAEWHLGPYVMNLLLPQPCRKQSYASVQTVCLRMSFAFSLILESLYCGLQRAQTSLWGPIWCSSWLQCSGWRTWYSLSYS